jgi:hypothetical protein
LPLPFSPSPTRRRGSSARMPRRGRQTWIQWLTPPLSLLQLGLSVSVVARSYGEDGRR